MIHGMISLKINCSLKLHHVTTAHVTLTRWIVIVGLRLWLVQFWRAVFNEINKVPSVAIATPHHSTSPLPLTHPSPLPLTPSPHHSLKGPNQTKIFVKSHLFMSLNLCRTFLSLKTFFSDNFLEKNNFGTKVGIWQRHCLRCTWTYNILETGISYVRKLFRVSPCVIIIIIIILSACSRVSPFRLRVSSCTLYM